MKSFALVIVVAVAAVVLLLFSLRKSARSRDHLEAPEQTLVHAEEAALAPELLQPHEGDRVSAKDPNEGSTEASKSNAVAAGDSIEITPAVKKILAEQNETDEDFRASQTAAKQMVQARSLLSGPKILEKYGVRGTLFGPEVILKDYVEARAAGVLRDVDKEQALAVIKQFQETLSSSLLSEVYKSPLPKSYRARVGYYDDQREAWARLNPQIEGLVAIFDGRLQRLIGPPKESATYLDLPKETQ